MLLGINILIFNSIQIAKYFMHFLTCRKFKLNTFNVARKINNGGTSSP